MIVCMLPVGFIESRRLFAFPAADNAALLYPLCHRLFVSKRSVAAGFWCRPEVHAAVVARSRVSRGSQPNPCDVSAAIRSEEAKPQRFHALRESFYTSWHFAMIFCMLPVGFVESRRLFLATDNAALLYPLHYRILVGIPTPAGQGFQLRLALCGHVVPT